MNYFNYLRSTLRILLLESTWTLYNMVIQVSPVQKLRVMSGLKVFLSQTCHYSTCHFANAFEYKGTGLYHSRTKHYKLSRAFIQLLADRLHGVNPFSPLPLCKPFHFAYRPGLLTHVILDLLTKHTSPMTTNKHRMETRHFCHGQMCGAWHTMRVGDGTREGTGEMG